jgi:uncharacterized Zn-binding protein involved in type VI secretion
MPEQCRLRDLSKVQPCVHGCPGCPHTCIGPATAGSPDVLVNNQPAIRMTDVGVHGGCCNGNYWKAIKGSSNVFINNLPAHRKGDTDAHCGGIGQMTTGSPNVITGG